MINTNGYTISTQAAIRLLNGEPIMRKDGDAENAMLKPYTFQDVCCTALLEGDWINDKGDRKIKRFRLAQKLYEADAVALTAEEVVLLKDLLEKTFPPLIYARALDILEPES